MPKHATCAHHAKHVGRHTRGGNRGGGLGESALANANTDTLSAAVNEQEFEIESLLLLLGLMAETISKGKRSELSTEFLMCVWETVSEHGSVMQVHTVIAIFRTMHLEITEYHYGFMLEACARSSPHDEHAANLTVLEMMQQGLDLKLVWGPLVRFFGEAQAVEMLHMTDIAIPCPFDSLNSGHSADYACCRLTPTSNREVQRIAGDEIHSKAHSLESGSRSEANTEELGSTFAEETSGGSFSASSASLSTCSGHQSVAELPTFLSVAPPQVPVIPAWLAAELVVDEQSLNKCHQVGQSCVGLPVGTCLSI